MTVRDTANLHIRRCSKKDSGRQAQLARLTAFAGGIRVFGIDTDARSDSILKLSAGSVKELPGQLPDSHH
jgi:hypothetical protein